MGIFGNYDGQAIANMNAMRAARAAVIDDARASQQRVREAVATLPANTGGYGRLINIYI